MPRYLAWICGALRPDTYSSAVDSIVNASKLLHCRSKKVLHTFLIGNLNLDRDGLVLCMFGVLFALLGGLRGAFFVEVSEDDSLDTSLCKR